MGLVYAALAPSSSCLALPDLCPCLSVMCRLGVDVAAWRPVHCGPLVRCRAGPHVPPHLRHTRLPPHLLQDALLPRTGTIKTLYIETQRHGPTSLSPLAFPSLRPFPRPACLTLFVLSVVCHSIGGVGVHQEGDRAVLPQGRHAHLDGALAVLQYVQVHRHGQGPRLLQAARIDDTPLHRLREGEGRGLR